MSPIKVRLSEDVYRACLSHALSTENEEIMGLLIGDIAGGDVDDKDEDTSCKVVSIVQLRILQRLDKRKDRVEISAKQLSEGVDYVEKLKKFMNRPDLKVVGWYHSHPRITVWPSEVDLRTQLSFQLMDENMVGLIFSVFDTSVESKVSRFDLTCFQTDKKTGRRIDIDVEIFVVDESGGENKFRAPILHEAARLPDILYREEEDTCKQLVPSEDLDRNWVTNFKNQNALKLAAANIWQTVAAPLLEQNQKELDILELEIKALELQLAKKRALKQKNAESGAESDHQDGAKDGSEDVSEVDSEECSKNGDEEGSENDTEDGTEDDTEDGAKNLEAATSEEEHFEDTAEGQSTEDSSA